MSPWEEVWCHYRNELSGGGRWGLSSPLWMWMDRREGDWYTENLATHKEQHTVGSQDR